MAVAQKLFELLCITSAAEASGFLQQTFVRLPGRINAPCDQMTAFVLS